MPLILSPIDCASTCGAVRPRPHARTAASNHPAAR
jgi:hypothetical protein